MNHQTKVKVKVKFISVIAVAISLVLQPIQWSYAAELITQTGGTYTPVTSAGSTTPTSTTTMTQTVIPPDSTIAPSPLSTATQTKTPVTSVKTTTPLPTTTSKSQTTSQTSSVQTSTVLPSDQNTIPTINVFTQAVSNGNDIKLTGRLSNFDRTKQKLILQVVDNSTNGQVAYVDITFNVQIDGTFGYTLTLNPGWYKATLSIVDRATLQTVRQSILPNVVHSEIFKFYGGAVPTGYQVTRVISGSAAWSITIKRPSCPIADTNCYQRFELEKTVSNVVRLKQIVEYGYNNNQGTPNNSLTRFCEFVYANSASTTWQTIKRSTVIPDPYPGRLVYRSTIRIVTYNGVPSYQLDYTDSSTTDVILGAVSSMTLAQVFAQSFLRNGVQG